jgi:RNA polymerase sigma-70 factor (ECF subfamily)
LRPRKGLLRYGVLARLPRYEFDRDYVDRLVAEDPEVEQHFTRYFGSLLSLKLRSRLRSAALVEDAKQETFVRVLTSLKQKRNLATPETLGAFVNSVCNNVLFELYRSAARTTPLPDEYDEPDQRQSGADSVIMAEEERGRVRAALAELTSKEQDLLRWLFFEGRDKDEVCRELNVDRNYLRVLLHRAKARFRERFTDEEAF